MFTRPRAAATALVAIAGVAGLTLALASPAHAAGDRVNDRTNDVTKVAETGEPVPGTTSTNKTAEVRFATLNHGNRIVLKTSVTDLRPNDQVGAYGVLRTTDNDKYVLRSFRADGQVRELALTRNGEARSCAARNLASNFDASKNVITLEVARSCLGNPTAVQWGVSVAAFKPNGDIVVDDARRNGNPPDGPEGTKVGDSVPFN